MREHEVNKLDNFIGGWYMDDTKLCDELMAFHYMTPYKSSGKTGNYRSAELVEDKETKESTDCILNDNRKLYDKYITHINDIIRVYTEKYPKCNFYAPYSDMEMINIQHYTPGQGFHAWHTERSSGRPRISARHLVFLTYLNDVTDDGETEFFHQKLKVKPEKGLTIIWPTDWTFTHRGVTSPTQEKYVATGWLSYNQ
jgi:prolyl 4-hydroxylase